MLCHACGKVPQHNLQSISIWKISALPTLPLHFSFYNGRNCGFILVAGFSHLHYGITNGRVTKHVELFALSQSSF
ncbi:hypothetical protein Nepgr_009686 [Nepenthes gracilis]|uniref:Uncharacterized protein n=1 Tax=Nepenthes gracilis TaxID=150966 RepID=A0AAD3XKM9_NEPGR|nr:hypothetical protein Nepgr_009686 [Nepenthes gracilis]